MSVRIKLNPLKVSLYSILTIAAMFGHESRLRLKEIFVYYAEQEIAIEKIRQILAAMRDFEPYTAFKRLDREYNGFGDAETLTHF